MTAQISDIVIYRKKEFDTAGISGVGWFDPAEHGLRPVACSTDCWRGYHCTYEIDEGQLNLVKLNISFNEEDSRSAERGEKPILFGRVPRRYIVHGHSWDTITEEERTSWEPHDFLVDGLKEPIQFTGGLLLGDGFIRQLYVHMGFHPAWKYRNVFEILFEGGRVVEEIDRSAAIAETRVLMAEQPLQPTEPHHRAEIKAWIDQCFSHDYSSDRVKESGHAPLGRNIDVQPPPPRSRPEYDEDRDLYDYVKKFFPQLLSDVEQRVHWRSKDPIIKAMLADGYESYRHRVCERLRNSAAALPLINRCPSCQRVVRTPKAKQCMWCGNDWH